DMFPNDDIMALVDYNNDVITDSLKVADALGTHLNAVRVDTSKTLVDKYFLRNQHLMGKFDPRGVNPELIFALRRALDDAGHRSEEHTSELQSRFDLVCRLLLEKKKKATVL